MFALLKKGFYFYKNFFNNLFSEIQTNSAKEKTVLEQEPGDPRIEWEAEA